MRVQLTSEQALQLPPDMEPFSNWTLEEDEYFWLELIPKSKFAADQADEDAYTEDQLAEMMEKRFGPNGPREYTRDEIGKMRCWKRTTCFRNLFSS